MKRFYNFFVEAGTWTGDWLLLLVRVFWGTQFAMAGWSKLHDLASTAGFFSGLGIPFADFNAQLVAYVELIGGIALVLGLLSRLITLPLIITMLVALLTTHVASLTDPAAIVKETPFNYLLASLLVFCFGAGKYSLDNYFSGGKR